MEKTLVPRKRTEAASPSSLEGFLVEASLYAGTMMDLLLHLSISFPSGTIKWTRHHGWI